MAMNTTRFPLRATHPRSATAQRTSGPRPQQTSDDEILGLVTAVPRLASYSSDNGPGSENPTPAIAVQPSASVASNSAAGVAAPSVSTPGASTDAAAQSETADSPSQSTPPAALTQILDTHPQLRDAWEAAQQFRAVFATPAEAQDAKAQLSELDGLFFSSQPGDQAALAARIHDLSPGAFHALAQAMQAHGARVAAASASDARIASPASSTVTSSTASTNSPAIAASASTSAPAAPVSSSSNGAVQVKSLGSSSGPTSVQPSVQPSGQSSAQSVTDPRRAAQLAFFHSTNSAAVQQILGAIESQVNHLLPAGVSAPTKTRIVGEIYRDLGSALRANRQLGQQLRDAFRSGAGDAAHQQAILSLVTGRAKQALPSITRRVINEWTHGVVAASQERSSRQDASAKRVDIAGGGSSDGVNRKPATPRDMDYKRLSDADILNL